MSTLKWIITLFISLTALFVGVQLFFHFNGRVAVAENKTAYLNALNTREEFAAFEGAPLDEAYPSITSVKAVYDLKRKQTISGCFEVNCISSRNISSHHNLRDRFQRPTVQKSPCLPFFTHRAF